MSHLTTSATSANGATNTIDTAVVPDLNGNGSSEIAALWVDFVTGKHTVQIKDAKSKAAVATLQFLQNPNLTSSYIPRAVTVSPDSDGNGFDEITVLARHKTTGKDVAEQRDSKTGNKLNSVAF